MRGRVEDSSAVSSSSSTGDAETLSRRDGSSWARMGVAEPSAHAPPAIAASACCHALACCI
eukprot:scaffold328946_cov66-Tisochrysis_lutea.AAC.2